MLEQPGIVVDESVLFVALVILSVFISLVLWRRHIRGKAPRQIAEALGDCEQKLGNCVALFKQIDAIRQRSAHRSAQALTQLCQHAESLVATAEPEIQSMTKQWLLLCRHPAATGPDARTYHMFVLREKLLPLVGKVELILQQAQSCHDKLRDEERHGPARIASASRQFYAELTEALEEHVHVLRTQYGLQGEMAHLSILWIEQAEKALRQLPSMLWNNGVRLDAGAIPTEYIDQADRVIRRHRKKAQSAMERLQNWQSSIEAVARRYQNVEAARKQLARQIEPLLKEMPDPVVAADWSKLCAELTTINRQLSALDVNGIAALDQDLQRLSSQVQALDQLTNAVNQNRRDCQRLKTPRTPRDAGWFTNANSIALSLSAFRPDNVANSVGCATLGSDVQKVHNSWQAVHADGKRRWQAWAGLTESIAHINTLDDELDDRLAAGRQELASLQSLITVAEQKIEECDALLNAFHEDYVKPRTVEAYRVKLKTHRERLAALTSRQGSVRAITEDIQTLANEIGNHAGEHARTIAAGITAQADTLRAVYKSLAQMADLKDDSTLKSARTVLTREKARPQIEFGSHSSLTDSIRLLGELTDSLKTSIAAVSHWQQLLDRLHEAIKRATASLSEAANHLSTVLNLLPAWIDVTSIDESVSNSTKEAGQATRRSTASATLADLNANLQYQLNALQQTEQTYKRHTEMLEQVHEAQQQWTRRSKQPDVSQNSSKSNVLAILVRSRPSNHALIPIDRALDYFGDLIRDLDNAINDNTDRGGSSAPADDSALRTQIEDLEELCDLLIAQNMPLRSLQTHLRKATGALSSAGHRSRRVALPHLRQAMDEVKVHIANAEHISDERQRKRRLGDLNNLRDGISEALNLAEPEQTRRFW